MNRWTLYETLKHGKRIDIKELDGSKAEEVKEGLIEYLMYKERNGSNEKR